MSRDPLFVVPVDFSPEMEATVSKAFSLARQCGADVHLLEVVPRARPSRTGDWGHDHAGPFISRRDWSRLEHSMHSAERQGIHARIVAYRGDAISVISSYLQLTEARLLVIGKHYGTSRWRRSSSVVSSLSRSSPAPVLVLPPYRKSSQNGRHPFSHIVSAVDFSVASAVAVRTVVDLVRRTGARLTLVHTLKDAPRHMSFSGAEALHLAQDVQSETTRVAERIRRKIQTGVSIRVNVRVTTGDPHRAIINTATDVSADLIVMGVPPRNRIDEAMFGSTFRRVLRQTKIPLLVLPVPAGAYDWLDDTDRVDVAFARMPGPLTTTDARKPRG